MLFNSIEFVYFFLVVFVAYHFLLKEKTKAQNVFLLAASYFFYGYADLKMLPLLIGVTVIFYFLGLAIGNAKTEKMNSFWSVVGIVLGVGVLVYFKYLNSSLWLFFPSNTSSEYGRRICFTRSISILESSTFSPSWR